MPGITGIIRKSHYPSIEKDLDAMVAVLCHNPKSKTGRHIDESVGIWLGWASHPGSYSDCMPLVVESDDVVILFHGEHFSSGNEAGDRLGEEASRNATTLLSLYAAHGDRFYAALNGWFSGVVIDRRQRRVTLFNDRYAMGRIYYHETEEEFVFSSEAKSLLRVRPSLRTLSPEGVAQQLRYNCVLGTRTLFEGVHVLPHAAAWLFRCGKLVSKEQYFAFHEWEQQRELGPDEFYRRWAQTVTDVFPRYLSDGNRVAMSLTAGLDTRLIMAALRERNRDHRVYTFGGAWGELYDVRTARKAARVYDQQFDVIRINDAFLSNIGDYAAEAVRVSDGCHDAFGAHDVFFNKIARDIAPIRLTGKFGSEVVRIRRLLGTVGYKPGLLRPQMQALVDGLPHFQATNADGNHLTRVVTEEISWHEYGRVVVEQAYLTMRTPYMDNELVKLMYQAPKGSRAAGDLQEMYVKDFAPEFAAFITNLGRFASPNPTLTSMAYYPFWVLFKIEYIYLQATPHWMTRLDRTLAGLHLERLFGGRQKWEAYRIWIKTHMADFVQSTLLNPQAEYTEYFDYATMSRMIRQHVAGTHNYMREINRALSLQLIHATLLKA